MYKKERKKENSGFYNISLAFLFLQTLLVLIRREGDVLRKVVVEYKETPIKSTTNTNMKCVHIVLMLNVAHCTKSKE